MAVPVISRIRRHEIERFARFALVGIAGTLVDFGALIALKELAGLPVLLANTLAYSAGIANNFTLNRLWTYPDARGKKVWIQFGQFAAISAVGLLINNAIVGLRLFSANAPLTGQATTLVAVLFLGSIQLICTGIIGEYLGRMIDEVKGRPLYLIEQTWGIPR